ncbi:G-protein coupled receptor moody-like [Centruroides sculpturatus]|uniref:G-protein coupled receptor moody-like n=1 Tax=Centruroides sculpturatus TaxID=218467 RepID=UPI000C6E0B70|nr:G-protein coupled receptor moody-like [Centruroides sculpturatus]
MNDSIEVLNWNQGTDFINVNLFINDSVIKNDSSVINVTTVPLFETYPKELLYFAAAACIVFVFIGVPGNFVTIVALLKSPRLRNVTSAFIINLCVADGLFCIFSLPLAASMFIHKTWIYSDFLCMIFPLFRSSNAAVSLFTIIAITINRYVIIVHPKSYTKIYTKMNISVIIAFIWLVSFALMTPTALGIWGKYAFNPEVGTCTVVKVNGKSSKTFIHILAFVIPCFIFVFCYSRIFWIVRKSKRKLKIGHELKKEEKSVNLKLKCCGKKAEKSEREKKQKQSKDLKVLKVILVIFLAFVFCYTPIIFVKIFKKEKSLPALNILGYLGGYSTACINPIIYVITSREYRRAYKELFVCNKTVHSVTETRNTSL